MYEIQFFQFFEHLSFMTEKYSLIPTGIEHDPSWDQVQSQWAQRGLYTFQS